MMKFDTRTPLSLSPWALVLAAALGVAACGGGDGDAGSSGPGAPQLPGGGTDPGTPPTPPSDDSAAIGDCGVANFVAEATAQINAFRAAARTCGSGASAANHAAAPALQFSTVLTQAAANHSQDMVAKNYFAHTSPSGVDLQARVEGVGYRWRAIGENIAAGQSTMASVMTGWQQSAGHCANLMNPNFTEVGLSCKRGGAGNTYGTYWTMTLARPR